MKPYQNLNGNSTVQSFQIYGDAIKVKFSDESVFLYLYEKTGKDIVEKMKALAIAGQGLGTYISDAGKGLGENLKKS